MPCVINDSDPETVENREGAAEEVEQKKKQEEGKGGREKKLKTLD